MPYYKIKYNPQKKTFELSNIDLVKKTKGSISEYEDLVKCFEATDNKSINHIKLTGIENSGLTQEEVEKIIIKFGNQIHISKIEFPNLDQSKSKSKSTQVSPEQQSILVNLYLKLQSIAERNRFIQELEVNKNQKLVGKTSEEIWNMTFDALISDRLLAPEGILRFESVIGLTDTTKQVKIELGEDLYNQFIEYIFRKIDNPILKEKHLILQIYERSNNFDISPFQFFKKINDKKQTVPFSSINLTYSTTHDRIPLDKSFFDQLLEFLKRNRHIQLIDINNSCYDIEPKAFEQFKEDLKTEKITTLVKVQKDTQYDQDLAAIYLENNRQKESKEIIDLSSEQAIERFKKISPPAELAYWWKPITETKLDVKRQVELVQEVVSETQTQQQTEQNQVSDFYLRNILTKTDAEKILKDREVSIDGIIDSLVGLNIAKEWKIEGFTEAFISQVLMHPEAFADGILYDPKDKKNENLPDGVGVFEDQSGRKILYYDPTLKKDRQNAIPIELRHHDLSVDILIDYKKVAQKDIIEDMFMQFMNDDYIHPLQQELNKKHAEFLMGDAENLPAIKEQIAKETKARRLEGLMAIINKFEEKKTDKLTDTSIVLLNDFTDENLKALRYLFSYKQYDGLKLFLEKCEKLQDKNLYHHFKEFFIDGKSSLKSLISNDSIKAIDKLLSLSDREIIWWNSLLRTHSNLHNNLADTVDAFITFCAELKKINPGIVLPSSLPNTVKGVNIRASLQQLLVIIQANPHRAQEQLDNLNDVLLGSDHAYHAIKNGYQFVTKEMALAPEKSDKKLSYQVSLDHLIKSTVPNRRMYFFRYLGYSNTSLPIQDIRTIFNKVIKANENLSPFVALALSNSNSRYIDNDKYCDLLLKLTDPHLVGHLTKLADKYKTFQMRDLYALAAFYDKNPVQHKDHLNIIQRFGLDAINAYVHLGFRQKKNEPQIESFLGTIEDKKAYPKLESFQGRIFSMLAVIDMLDETKVKALLAQLNELGQNPEKLDQFLTGINSINSEKTKTFPDIDSIIERARLLNTNQTVPELKYDVSTIYTGGNPGIDELKKYAEINFKKPIDQSESKQFISALQTALIKLTDSENEKLTIIASTLFKLSVSWQIKVFLLNMIKQTNYSSPQTMINFIDNFTAFSRYYPSLTAALIVQSETETNQKIVKEFCQDLYNLMAKLPKDDNESLLRPLINSKLSLSDQSTIIKLLLDPKSSSYNARFILSLIGQMLTRDPTLNAGKIIQLLPKLTELKEDKAVTQDPYQKYKNLNCPSIDDFIDKMGKQTLEAIFEEADKNPVGAEKRFSNEGKPGYDENIKRLLDVELPNSSEAAKEKLIADFHKVNTIGKELESLTRQALIERLHKAMKSTKQADITELLACLRELLFRSPPHKFANEMQIISVLNSFSHGRFSLTAINTGQGKSIVCALQAAVMHSLGHTAVVLSSSSDLAKRDFEEFQSFFAALPNKDETLPKVDSAYVEKYSPSGTFKVGGINYATTSDFSLYWQSADLRGESLRKDFRGKKFTLSTVLDEEDDLLVSKAGRDHFVLSANDEGAHDTTWLYEHVNVFVDFLAEKERYLTNAESKNKEFVGLAKLYKETAQLPGIAEKLDKLNINTDTIIGLEVYTLLHYLLTKAKTSAERQQILEPSFVILLQELILAGKSVKNNLYDNDNPEKKGVLNKSDGFRIKEQIISYNDGKQDRQETHCSIEILVNGNAVPGLQYGDGYQQLLLARLKRDHASKPDYQFTIDPVRIKISTRSPDDLIRDLQKGDSLILGSSGSPGSAQQIQHKLDEYGFVPIRQKPQEASRLVPSTSLAENEKGVFDEVARVILENKDQPWMIHCDSLDKVKSLEQRLSKLGYVIKTLTAENQHESKKILRENAGQPKTIVISTVMRRGTDIITTHPEGLGVINLEIQSITEEEQIKGRTARRGQKGKYVRILAKDEIRRRYQEYFPKEKTCNVDDPKTIERIQNHLSIRNKPQRDRELVYNRLTSVIQHQFKKWYKEFARQKKFASNPTEQAKWDKALNELVAIRVKFLKDFHKEWQNLPFTIQSGQNLNDQIQIKAVELWKKQFEALEARWTSLGRDPKQLPLKIKNHDILGAYKALQNRHRTDAAPAPAPEMKPAEQPKNELKEDKKMLSEGKIESKIEHKTSATSTLEFGAVSDGNCAYNAFIIGLREAILRNDLEDNKDQYKDFIQFLNTYLTKKHSIENLKSPINWNEFKVYLKNTSHVEIQEKLAPVFREFTIVELIKKNSTDSKLHATRVATTLPAEFKKFVEKQKELNKLNAKFHAYIFKNKIKLSEIKFTKEEKDELQKLKIKDIESYVKSNTADMIDTEVYELLREKLPDSFQEVINIERFNEFKNRIINPTTETETTLSIWLPNLKELLGLEKADLKSFQNYLKKIDADTIVKDTGLSSIFTICMGVDEHINKKKEGEVKEDILTSKFIQDRFKLEYKKSKFQNLQPNSSSFNSKFTSSVVALNDWWKEEKGGHTQFLAEMNTKGTYTGDAELEPLARFWRVNLLYKSPELGNERDIYTETGTFDTSRLTAYQKAMLQSAEVLQGSKDTHLKWGLVDQFPIEKLESIANVNSKLYDFILKAISEHKNIQSTIVDPALLNSQYIPELVRRKIIQPTAKPGEYSYKYEAPIIFEALEGLGDQYQAVYAAWHKRPQLPIVRLINHGGQHWNAVINDEYLYQALFELSKIPGVFKFSTHDKSEYHPHFRSSFDSDVDNKALKEKLIKIIAGAGGGITLERLKQKNPIEVAKILKALGLDSEKLLGRIEDKKETLPDKKEVAKELKVDEAKRAKAEAIIKSIIEERKSNPDYAEEIKKINNEEFITALSKMLGVSKNYQASKTDKQIVEHVRIYITSLFEANLDSKEKVKTRVDQSSSLRELFQFVDDKAKLESFIASINQPAMLSMKARSIPNIIDRIVQKIAGKYSKPVLYSEEKIRNIFSQVEMKDNIFNQLLASPKGKSEDIYNKIANELSSLFTPSFKTVQNDSSTQAILKKYNCSYAVETQIKQLNDDAAQMLHRLEQEEKEKKINDEKEKQFKLKEQERLEKEKIEKKQQEEKALQELKQKNEKIDRVTKNVIAMIVSNLDLNKSTPEYPAYKDSDTQLAKCIESFRRIVTAEEALQTSPTNENQLSILITDNLMPLFAPGKHKAAIDQFLKPYKVDGSLSYTIWLMTSNAKNLQRQDAAKKARAGREAQERERAKEEQRKAKILDELKHKSDTERTEIATKNVDEAIVQIKTIINGKYPRLYLSLDTALAKIRNQLIIINKKIPYFSLIDLLTNSIQPGKFTDSDSKAAFDLSLDKDFRQEQTQEFINIRKDLLDFFQTINLDAAKELILTATSKYLYYDKKPFAVLLYSSLDGILKDQTLYNSLRYIVANPPINGDSKLFYEKLNSLLDPNKSTPEQIQAELKDYTKLDHVNVISAAFAELNKKAAIPFNEAKKSVDQAIQKIISNSVFIKTYPDLKMLNESSFATALIQFVLNNKLTEESLSQFLNANLRIGKEVSTIGYKISESNDVIINVINTLNANARNLKAKSIADNAIPIIVNAISDRYGNRYDKQFVELRLKKPDLTNALFLLASDPTILGFKKEEDQLTMLKGIISQHISPSNNDKNAIKNSIKKAYVFKNDQDENLDKIAQVIIELNQSALHRQEQTVITVNEVFKTIKNEIDSNTELADIYTDIQFLNDCKGELLELAYSINDADTLTKHIVHCLNLANVNSKEDIQKYLQQYTDKHPDTLNAIATLSKKLFDVANITLSVRIAKTKVNRAMTLIAEKIEDNAILNYFYTDFIKNLETYDNVKEVEATFRILIRYYSQFHNNSNDLASYVIKLISKPPFPMQKDIFELRLQAEGILLTEEVSRNALFNFLHTQSLIAYQKANAILDREFNALSRLIADNKLEGYDITLLKTPDCRKALIGLLMAGNLSTSEGRIATVLLHFLTADKPFDKINENLSDVLFNTDPDNTDILSLGAALIELNKLAARTQLQNLCVAAIDLLHQNVQAHRQLNGLYPNLITNLSQANVLNALVNILMAKHPDIPSADDFAHSILKYIKPYKKCDLSNNGLIDADRQILQTVLNELNSIKKIEPSIVNKKINEIVNNTRMLISQRVNGQALNLYPNILNFPTIRVAKDALERLLYNPNGKIDTVVLSHLLFELLNPALTTASQIKQILKDQGYYLDNVKDREHLDNLCDLLVDMKKSVKNSLKDDVENEAKIEAKEEAKEEKDEKEEKEIKIPHAEVDDAEVEDDDAKEGLAAFEEREETLQSLKKQFEKVIIKISKSVGDNTFNKQIHSEIKEAFRSPITRNPNEQKNIRHTYREIIRAYNVEPTEFKLPTGVVLNQAEIEDEADLANMAKTCEHLVINTPQTFFISENAAKNCAFQAELKENNILTIGFVEGHSIRDQFPQTDLSDATGKLTEAELIKADRLIRVFMSASGNSKDKPLYITLKSNTSAENARFVRALLVICKANKEMYGDNSLHYIDQSGSGYTPTPEEIQYIKTKQSQFTKPVADQTLEAKAINADLKELEKLSKNLGDKEIENEIKKVRQFYNETIKTGHFESNKMRDLIKNINDKIPEAKEEEPPRLFRR